MARKTVVEKVTEKVHQFAAEFKWSDPKKVKFRSGKRIIPKKRRIV